MLRCRCDYWTSEVRRRALDLLLCWMGFLLWQTWKISCLLNSSWLLWVCARPPSRKRLNILSTDLFLSKQRHVRSASAREKRITVSRLAHQRLLPRRQTSRDRAKSLKSGVKLTELSFKLCYSTLSEFTYSNGVRYKRGRVFRSRSITRKKTAKQKEMLRRQSESCPS